MHGKADEVRKSARRGTGPDAPVPSAEQVAQLGQQVLDQLLHAKDADGDALAEPFMRLPSRRQYPEYYVVIKKPVTLSEVRNRVKQQEYASLADFRADLELMCNNAKRFNMKDSDIWLKARDLHGMIKETTTDVYDAWAAEQTDKPKRAEKRAAADDSADAKRRRLAESVVRSAVPKEERETPKVQKITLRAPKSETPKSKEAEAKPEAKPAPKTAAPAAPAAPATPATPATHATPAQASPAPVSTPIARVVPPYTSPVVPRPITTPYITEPRRRGAPRGKRLKVMLRWAVQSITSLQDDSGRKHAEMFMELPSRQDYPDYYQFIQHPISFHDIDRKLDQKEYINPHALVSDLYRMLSNAQFYNEEHSEVWEDAQILRTHLEKVIIPALLAEGFTLDPNDHRQAALPPGTPGAVPPPGSAGSPVSESPPQSSPASPAPVHARPIVRVANVAPQAPRPVATPPARPTPVIEAPRPPAPPAPAAPAAPAVTLEQVVQGVENRTWPTHPAALTAPAAATAKPAHEPLPCFAEAVNLQLYADPDASELLANVRIALGADAVPQAIHLPRRTASAMIRLVLGEEEQRALRVTLNQREVGGAWLDGTATYAMHVALDGTSHALEAHTLETSPAGRVCIYMNK